MAEVIFITGGQRSGKSSYAQEIALEMTDKPIYLATARIWDQDFKSRVDRHRSDRDERWQTIEEEKCLSKLSLKDRVVVVDCITLWLTNFYIDHQYDSESAFKEATAEWDKFIDQDCRLIVISNEIGMGIHAVTEEARKFADIHGWLNQHIAKNADRVFLMISGIPLKVK